MNAEDKKIRRGFTESIMKKIETWVGYGTSTKTREFDKNWEIKAVGYFIEAELDKILSGKRLWPGKQLRPGKYLWSGKQYDEWAGFKIAVRKSKTFDDLRKALKILDTR